MYQSLTCLTSQLLYLLFCSKYKVHSVRTGYFLHFESVWIILNNIEIWITAYGFQKKCITEYGYKFKFPQNMDNAHILKFRFFWKTRKTFPNKIWLKRKPYEGGGGPCTWFIWKTVCFSMIQNLLSEPKKNILPYLSLLYPGYLRGSRGCISP